VTKAKQALSDQLQATKVEIIQMDQTSLQSVREAAKAILSRTNIVNILINNAGIMAVPELELNADGYEIQFTTNHLSHFLFFQLLKPALLAATTNDFQSRVVMVSASAHRIYSIHPDNYHFQNGGYEPWVAYAQSKCANIYLANEIDRRYGPLGLHAFSVHPGIIATEIGRFLSDETKEAMKQDKMLLRVLKTPEQGAATTVYAAVDKGLEGKGGRYLVNCTEAIRGPDDGQSSSETYVSHTYCSEKEAELWRDSLKMVGLEDDQ
jgi:NAD(P)-dependent dehydrogenase (short-subunit alcohol dehydrogenase family)